MRSLIYYKLQFAECCLNISASEKAGEVSARMIVTNSVGDKAEQFTKAAAVSEHKQHPVLQIMLSRGRGA